MKICIGAWWTIGTAMLLAMVGEQAHGNETLDGSTVLRAGLVMHDVSGEFSATRSPYPRVSIGLDDVGLDGNDLDRFLSASFDIGSNWRLRLDHFGYSRDGDRRIDADLNFDDLVVPVGASVNADAELWLYVANVAYRFDVADRWEFGFGVGVHVAQLAYELDAVARINNAEKQLGEDEEKLLLPLPNVYAMASYRLNDRILAYLGTGWFSMGYDEYDGQLVFTRAAVEYQFGRRLGMGAGYSFFEVDVDRKSDKRRENYDVEMPGYHLYLVLRF